MISPLSWLRAGGFSLSPSVISLWGYNEVSEGFAERFSPGIVSFPLPSPWQRYWALILFSFLSVWQGEDKCAVTARGWFQINVMRYLLQQQQQRHQQEGQQQGRKTRCHLHMTHPPLWASQVERKSHCLTRNCLSFIQFWKCWKEVKKCMSSRSFIKITKQNEQTNEQMDGEQLLQ